MTKRLIRLLFCTGLLAGLLTVTALAAEWTYNSGAETLTSGSVTLSNVTADGTNLTIGKNANFSGTLDLTGTITGSSGTETYTITVIGDGAFQSCANLKSITLPDSLTSIGNNAFEFCGALTSVNLSGCTGLKSIGDYAFWECGDLTAVELPDSLTSIGDNAFQSCVNLKSITLPDSLTSIGDNAFQQCGLTSVDLRGCTGLESIGDGAFRSCTGLTSVDLSGCSSLTSIGEYAFGYCEKLDTVDLSGCSSLKSIGSSIFAECSNLATVDLSGCSSLESIGNSAFRQCGLTTVDLSGCTSLESIGDYAFNNCEDLTAVTLPAGLKTIEDWAFANCSALTELVVLAETPPSLDTNALQGVSSSLRIVVPAESVEKYKQAAGWSTYAGSITAVGIAASPNTLAFGSAVQGGARPAAQTVTVTSPDVPVMLDMPASSFYEVAIASGTLSLGAGESVTFSVKPKDGLATGTYSEPLTISGSTDEGNVSVQATVNLTYSVSQPTYTVTVSASGGGTATGGGSYTAGDTVTLTATPNSGYRFVRWEENGTVASTSATYTFAASRDCALTAVFARNSGGGSSGGSTPSKTPSQQAADKIEAAKDGATVEITLKTGKTTLDKEVFEALAGRDVTLQISLPGGVMWTVNGEDIPADADLTDLDMGVSMNTSTIPVDIINALTGEVGTVQLTLAHDGEFGFALTLTAPLGKEYADLWANLYHYDAGALKFEAAARIAADGTVSLPFTHASEYAIIIDDRDRTPKAFPFADVRETDWFYDAVDFVYQNDLMNGTSAYLFEPDGIMTRAMLVVILHRQAGEPVVGYALPFADVAAGDWYTEAVRWAAAEGIVTGTSATTFAPDAPVTREQFAAILYRYAQKTGADVSAGEDTNILSYADALEISEYAIPAMQWACGAGVIEGSGGSLNPQDSATRAEAAAMLMRYLQL